jgi:hypothetical protein
MYLLGASSVSYAHRYRLGIAIEIDGQVYSGSSVMKSGGSAADCLIWESSSPLSLDKLSTLISENMAQ